MLCLACVQTLPAPLWGWECVVIGDDDMQKDFFGTAEYKFATSRVAAQVPAMFYKQERDWTCALACLRSLCSGIYPLDSEDRLIERYGFQPGPIYSKDIKAAEMLDEVILNVKYGCDEELPERLDPSDVWHLLYDGYFVMVNWMQSFDHWTVVLGYFPEQDPEKSQILYWCPYFNELRMVRAGDFEVMWHGGQQSGYIGPGDYIAIKLY